MKIIKRQFIIDKICILFILCLIASLIMLLFSYKLTVLLAIITLIEFVILLSNDDYILPIEDNLSSVDYYEGVEYVIDCVEKCNIYRKLDAKEYDSYRDTAVDRVYVLAFNTYLYLKECNDIYDTFAVDMYKHLEKIVSVIEYMSKSVVTKEKGENLIKELKELNVI